VKRVIVVKLKQNRNWIVEQGQRHLAYKYKRKRFLLLELVFQSLDKFSPNSIISWPSLKEISLQTYCSFVNAKKIVGHFF
jgi:hypothetical protein